jgi:hypothetical protein
VPGQEHSPPRRSDDFAAFARAVADRYGPNGSFWSAHPALMPRPVDTLEIWNEPDNAQFWFPTPDPARYADLYLRARNAILAVDPRARVVVGGLTNPAAFLPVMVRTIPGLVREIGGIAIHPYGADPGVVVAKVRAARATLAALGLGAVPLYVTEFGWTTSPPSALAFAPAQMRPGYIESTLVDLAHSGCGIAATLVYTWVTPERDPANREDWYGIHPPGGGASPDVDAFTAGIHRATVPGRPTPTPGTAPCESAPAGTPQSTAPSA